MIRQCSKPTHARSGTAEQLLPYFYLKQEQTGLPAFRPIKANAYAYENTYVNTGDQRKDIVGVALTQVGYTESVRNFEVDDTGIRHGYTRYGDWYGVPYSDWSATFVSFCLHTTIDLQFLSWSILVFILPWT